MNNNVARVSHRIFMLVFINKLTIHIINHINTVIVKIRTHIISIIKNGSKWYMNILRTWMGK